MAKSKGARLISYVAEAASLHPWGRDSPVSTQSPQLSGHPGAVFTKHPDLAMQGLLPSFPALLPVPARFCPGRPLCQNSALTLTHSLARSQSQKQPAPPPSQKRPATPHRVPFSLWGLGHVCLPHFTRTNLCPQHPTWHGTGGICAQFVFVEQMTDHAKASLSRGLGWALRGVLWSGPEMTGKGTPHPPCLANPWPESQSPSPGLATGRLSCPPTCRKKAGCGQGPGPRTERTLRICL